MQATILVLLVLSAFFALTHTFGLDCDNNNHACDTCVNSNCYWCHSGSNDDASFCTSNPNLCLKGSLFEDSLFCPVVKSSFESLDWWGENAFFSRAENCETFNGNGNGNANCERCIMFSGDLCGWCSSNQRCSKLNPAQSCPADFGCAKNKSGNVPAFEDTAITWNINELFVVYRETNTTGQLSTSTNYTLAAATLNSRCNVTVDADSNNITVTPSANWFGLCQARVSAATKFLLYGHNTTLFSYVTFDFASVNDAPAKADATYDAATAGLNSWNQTGSVALEGCKMFVDDDKVDFTISVSSVTTSGTAPTVTTGLCTCYTGSLSCPISLKAGGPWEGKITFSATDGINTTSTQHDITITAVNRAPVPVGGNVTISVKETDDVQPTSFSTDFQDPDGNSMTYTLVDGFGSLVTSASFDNEKLVITLNTTLINSTSATSRVTASDGSLTSNPKWVTLSVTAVNDPIVIADSLKGRTFTGASGTTSGPFDLTSLVTDEESSFAAGTLICTAGSLPGNEAIVSVNKSMLSIQHRQESGSVSCTITCNDTMGSVDTFDINIINTLVNQPPVAKAAFPSFSQTPPSSGFINLAPSLNFTDYFSDPNTFQTITYNVVASNSSAVGFSSLGNYGFTVVMFAGAFGSYTLNVTATDEKGASTWQLVRVLAYVQVGCQTSVALPWNPLNSLTVDMASYCTSSNTFNLTFTPNNVNSLITSSINGTKITFNTSDTCSMGSYSGSVMATDSAGGKNYTSLVLTFNNTQNSIKAKQSSFSYLVTSGTASSPYDGAIAIVNSEISIGLDQFITLCTSPGPVTFDNTTAISITTLEGLDNLKISSEIYSNGTASWLYLWGTPPAHLTQRKWMMTTTFKASDSGSSNTDTFGLTITKN